MTSLHVQNAATIPRHVRTTTQGLALCSRGTLAMRTPVCAGLAAFADRASLFFERAMNDNAQVFEVDVFREEYLFQVLHCRFCM